MCVCVSVLYEGKDPVRSGWHVVETTPYSRSASLSSGGPATHRTFLMFRRAPDSQALNTLGITEISLLMPSKGETGAAHLLQSGQEPQHRHGDDSLIH